MKHVKNTVVILLDTSKQNSIQIGKMEHTPPSDPQELADMMLLDISTMVEALVVTIKNASQMGIRTEAELIRGTINHIQDAFLDPMTKAEYVGGSK